MFQDGRRLQLQPKLTEIVATQGLSGAKGTVRAPLRRREQPEPLRALDQASPPRSAVGSHSQIYAAQKPGNLIKTCVINLFIHLFIHAVSKL